VPLVRVVDVDAASPEVRTAYERMATYAAGGLPGVRPRTSPLLGTLAHHPPLLHQHIDELTEVLADGALTRRTKETLVVAYSIANGCRYCTTNHAGTLRTRFGFTDAMLVELGATVAHVAGLLAYGQLARTGLVPEAGGERLREVVRLFGEAPRWYRALAASPATFERVWRREQILLSAPGLDAVTRALVGLVVSAHRADDEGLAWFAGQARRQGCSDEALQEAAAVVLLFARVNQFTIGMLLEPLSRQP
jgi:AhpD family alkylhydroperoxidase